MAISCLQQKKGPERNSKQECFWDSLFPKWIEDVKNKNKKTKIIISLLVSSQCWLWDKAHSFCSPLAFPELSVHTCDVKTSDAKMSSKKGWCLLQGPSWTRCHPQAAEDLSPLLLSGQFRRTLCPLKGMWNLTDWLHVSDRHKVQARPCLMCFSKDASNLTSTFL